MNRGKENFGCSCNEHEWEMKKHCSKSYNHKEQEKFECCEFKNYGNKGCQKDFKHDNYKSNWY